MMQFTRIASIQASHKSIGQGLLERLATQLLASNVRVVGVIEEAHALRDRSCSAGILRDIASGARHSIYLEVPPADTTCHIDAEGASRAGAALLEQIGGADIIVLSKFGKLEAGGAGLRSVFDAAIAAGKPLLTTVSSNHFAAWQALVPRATVLTPEMTSLQQWWNSIGASQA